MTGRDKKAPEKMDISRRVACIIQQKRVIYREAFYLYLPRSNNELPRYEGGMFLKRGINAGKKEVSNHIVFYVFES